MHAVPSLDAARGAMLDRLRAAGYARTETPVLGPASVFLDFSGEEIRAALFLTADGAGGIVEIDLIAKRS